MINTIFCLLDQYIQMHILYIKKIKFLLKLMSIGIYNVKRSTILFKNWIHFKFKMKQTLHEVFSIKYIKCFTSPLNVLHWNRMKKYTFKTNYNYPCIFLNKITLYIKFWRICTGNVLLLLLSAQRSYMYQEWHAEYEGIKMAISKSSMCFQ